jgi:hypothetical protein
MHQYPLFMVTMIMSDLTEDEKIKAFVQALTLALQNIVGKSPRTAVNKHKPQKHKTADKGNAKRVDPES